MAQSYPEPPKNFGEHSVIVTVAGNRLSGREFSADRQPDYQCTKEQHDEYSEQPYRDHGGRGFDVRKAENGGDHGNNQKNHGPFQHLKCSFLTDSSPIMGRTAAKSHGI